MLKIPSVDLLRSTCNFAALSVLSIWISRICLAVLSPWANSYQALSTNQQIHKLVRKYRASIDCSVSVDSLTEPGGQMIE